MRIVITGSIREETVQNYRRCEEVDTQWTGDRGLSSGPRILKVLLEKTFLLHFSYSFKSWAQAGTRTVKP